MTAFGPVPSRRLGRSLGINNIPSKICTYSCSYCQIGRTVNSQTERKEFIKPERILEDVEKKVAKARIAGEAIDYLTFVPNGEPTLDVHLGSEIESLKPLGIRIAVITNSSLMSREDVQDDLGRAHCVSLKIDAVSRDIWRKINRPCRSLEFEEILRGISKFALSFKGDLITETMLVQGINDGVFELDKIAGFVAGLKPAKSYLAVPTRPPACREINPANEQCLNAAYQLFKEKSVDAEYLTGFEGNAFACTGNVEEDLLSITSVHPMREDSVKEYLEKANAGWTAIEKLIKEDKLKKVTYKGKNFFVRRLPEKIA